MSGNIEIERKFKLAHDGWKAAVSGEPVRMVAGYVDLSPPARAWAEWSGEQGTFHLDSHAGARFAWPIPAADAEELERLGVTSNPKAALRIRFEDDRPILTLKAPPTDADGRVRPEFNWLIDQASAEALLACPLITGTIIRKRRWSVPAGAHTFIVDVFESPRAGLEMAEIELSAGDEAFERPDWLGEEITLDPAYSNAAIAAAG